jgi:3-methyladenine DNA glycosylase AlkD
VTRRRHIDQAHATLIDGVKGALAAHADAARAPAMQAYMKSAMPYRGVPAPVMRRACRTVFAAHPLDSFEVWQATVLRLWRSASYREERYAAIELTGQRRYASYQMMAALPMYEEMIVACAWWDYVDAIAIHRLGAVLRREPADMRERMLGWSRSPDVWKRRSAILCQVSFKRDTDRELLFGCIEPNFDDRAFFIRKAIGWALRSYAWVDPDEVVRFVCAHEQRLSPLSRREALKNISRMMNDE